MDKAQIKRQEIDEKEDLISKNVFKLIDIHPQANAIKIKSNDDDISGELSGIKFNSKKFDYRIDTYNHMMDTIKDMLNRDGNSEEVNNKLIELLNKVREDMKELEINKRKYLRKINNIIKLGGGTLIGLGISLGVGVISKDINNKK